MNPHLMLEIVLLSTVGFMVAGESVDPLPTLPHSTPSPAPTPIPIPTQDTVATPKGSSNRTSRVQPVKRDLIPTLPLKKLYPSLSLSATPTPPSSPPSVASFPSSSSSPVPSSSPSSSSPSNVSPTLESFPLDSTVPNGSPSPLPLPIPSSPPSPPSPTAPPLSLPIPSMSAPSSGNLLPALSSPSPSSPPSPSGLPVPSMSPPKPSSITSSLKTNVFKPVIRRGKELVDALTMGFTPQNRFNVYVERGDDGQSKMTRMVEIVTRPNVIEIGPPKVIECRIYGHSRTVENKLKSMKDNPPKHVTADTMNSLLEKCQRHILEQMAENKYERIIPPMTDLEEETLLPFPSPSPPFSPDDPSSPSSTTSPDGIPGLNPTMKPEKGITPDKKGFFDGIAIYPGTKWCGAGNVASNYDDLGADKATDMCCREHDSCPENIPAMGINFNLTNKDQYTKSSCDCDDKFYLCLKNANSFIGHQVGRLYFNILQTQCFKEAYPIVNCTRVKGFVFNQVRNSCQDYSVDETRPKTMQFFDPPFYDGDSGPLFNIPVLTDLINSPIKAVKKETINGGLIGNVVG